MQQLYAIRIVLQMLQASLIHTFCLLRRLGTVVNWLFLQELFLALLCLVTPLLVLNVLLEQFPLLVLIDWLVFFLPFRKNLAASFEPLDDAGQVFLMSLLLLSYANFDLMQLSVNQILVNNDLSDLFSLIAHSREFSSWLIGNVFLRRQWSLCWWVQQAFFVWVGRNLASLCYFSALVSLAQQLLKGLLFQLMLFFVVFDLRIVSHDTFFFDISPGSNLLELPLFDRLIVLLCESLLIIKSLLNYFKCFLLALLRICKHWIYLHGGLGLELPLGLSKLYKAVKWLFT